ncbi:hypothetical protein [Arthrobacter sp. EM1]|uniref:hypothetical protein n=1 Tax=Arthrobacter sp. EM1 TaxID=3043847 RepID=UPI00249EDCE2|nr:hypothetical protein [Arthrobacter sp. EM1]MCB5281881.1 hypothetical protein [Arthrobacter sp. ES1]WGZ78115.1 hypothetical protein QI450_09280 [Arthrobacter sp. EM1]
MKRFLIPAGVLLLGSALGSCSGGTKEASDVTAAEAPSLAAPSAAAVAVAPRPVNILLRVPGTGRPGSSNLAA